MRPRADFYRSTYPGPQDVLLIVEVADSSLRYDCEIKIPLYARFQIPEVWLVDLENRRLVAFRIPTAQGYREVIPLDPADVIAPMRLTDCRVDLSRLFV